MIKKLLFFCELSAGHLNVAIALSRMILQLYKEKFEIWFLVNEEYRKKVNQVIKNCKFIIYSRTSDNESNLEETKQQTIKFFSEFGEKWSERDRIKFIHNGGHTYEDCFEDAKKNHENINKLIKDLKPDLILIDSLMTIPTGINLGIPYVLILSAAPTFFGKFYLVYPNKISLVDYLNFIFSRSIMIYSKTGYYQLPPPRSSLPGDYTDENRIKWEKFIKEAYKKEDFIKFMAKANNFLKENNSPVNFDDTYIYYVQSPYLNIYNYPKELDYETDVVKMPGNWVRIDSAVIDIPPAFPIPKKLENLPGKLIYFSLGSMASCYKPLMNRLLKIFSEISHRFIVSKGLVGEEFELFDNQYGENFLNQLSVLQSVDVYITHGGNNGLTESCHFGVPMIVIPLFADQFDNAKRIEEKNYGITLNAFHSEKEEFEKAIEFCLDEKLKEKLQKMSNRIKKDNGLKQACKSIINLIQ